MSELGDLLADPKLHLLRVKVDAPEPRALHKAVADIADTGGSLRTPEAVAALQERVSAFARAGALQQLSRRDLREACKVFFHPPHALAEDEGVGWPLVAEVTRLERRAAFFALIDAYLDAFEPEERAVIETAKRLSAASEKWPWRDRDLWQDRAIKFHLFDPEIAPAAIAKAVLDTDLAPARTLDELGLNTDGRRTGGLAEAAFRSACDLVAGMAPQGAPDAQRKLIEWASARDGELIFRKSFRWFVQACLLPWERTEPTDAHKAQLVDCLERFGGGDPRSQPTAWRDVEENARAAYDVLLRWLTRASVMQFLDIVDRSLRDVSSRTMWAYRRAFWTSYLLAEQGPRIQRAWVAFGDDGARLALQTSRASGDKTFEAFGYQADKSSQHAALLVEIGDLLIVDWSHSAKYNVWRRRDANRPELFKENYEYGQLYSAPLQESHVSPSTYSWQKRLAAIIEGRQFFSPKQSWKPKRV